MFGLETLLNLYTDSRLIKEREIYTEEKAALEDRSFNNS